MTSNLTLIKFEVCNFASPDSKQSFAHDLLLERKAFLLEAIRILLLETASGLFSGEEDFRKTRNRLNFILPIMLSEA